MTLLSRSFVLPKRTKSNKRTGLSPTLAILLFMVAYPIFSLVYYSFLNFSALRQGAMKPMGLKNYKFLLSDPELWERFVFTGKFVALCVSAQMLIGIFILWRVGAWYAEHRRINAGRMPASTALLFDKRTTLTALAVLTILTLTKNAYMAGLSSYYTFYLIHKFGVAVQDSQLLLFVYLGASAVGVFLGGPLGDRFGVKFVIWFSIVGVLPFTLALPYADLNWTVILTILIGLIFSSAFSAIVVFAQELMPGRVGMIAGIFFGFAFGAGGIAAAALGALADVTGIEYVFWLISFLPLAGLLTVFLPKMQNTVH